MLLKRLGLAFGWGIVAVLAAAALPAREPSSRRHLTEAPPASTLTRQALPEVPGQAPLLAAPDREILPAPTGSPSDRAAAPPSVLIGPAVDATPLVIDIPLPDQSGGSAGQEHAPCITYRERGVRRSCLSDQPDFASTLLVCNPRTGCTVCVPVCLPVCCLDEPCVDSRKGLFQRGIVTYEYACGLRIVVVFDRHGDLTVTYHYA
ncbi:MAG: hypothetical protein SFX18_15800 [Pirellulales bacterium]|nr:hypothetical protein [Pirellulales bacterium]